MNSKDLDKKLQKEAGQLVAQGLLEKPWYTHDPDDVEIIVHKLEYIPDIFEMSIYNQFLKRMMDASVKYFEQQQKELKQLRYENEQLRDMMNQLIGQCIITSIEALQNE